MRPLRTCGELRCTVDFSSATSQRDEHHRRAPKGEQTMAKKTSGQIVTRPGRRPSDPPIQIPVADDLLNVPGIPLRQNEVDFCSREYPIESQNIDMSADRQWATSVLSPEAYEHRKE